MVLLNARLLAGEKGSVKAGLAENRLKTAFKANNSTFSESLSVKNQNHANYVI